MALRKLISTNSVEVFDYVCEAGPERRGSAEVHCACSVSYVRKSGFGYRSSTGRFDLVAGSTLIGYAGDEYECSHDHTCGDECLSFQISPEFMSELDDRPTVWRTGALPPVAKLVALGELAQSVAVGDSDVGLDEVGVLYAASVCSIARAGNHINGGVTSRERRQALEVATWLEDNAHSPIDLGRTAALVGLSRYHFLRIFGRVLGITPHQFLIMSRIRLAAKTLLWTESSVRNVSLDVGFLDLSNFLRTFRRAVGVSPTQFRNIARGDSNILRELLSRSGISTVAPDARVSTGACSQNK